MIKSNIIKSKITFSFIFLILLLLLTGCSNRTDYLGSFSVYERIEPEYDRSYYAAIRDQREDYLYDTLYPEDEIAVSISGNFYGRNLDIEEVRSRKDYVSSYQQKYFPGFVVDNIELEDISISNPSEGVYIYQAEVTKTFLEVPSNLDSDYILEYSVEFEIVKEEGIFYIVRIDKTN